MTAYKHYFIVGTNDNALHDTMNGNVTGELIRCKDCRHYETDHFENFNGIPLIVSHEICMRWGDGCMTSQDGYCFMAERKEE